jgi:hypothetical protein
MLLTGMGSPTCTQSDIPLGGPEDGFVDHYLIGEWRTWRTAGGEGEKELVFELDGPLQIRLTYANKEFVGYSTWLNGNKYLNLRTVDCHDCSDEERDLLEGNVCPYQILRYWTYVPEFILTELSESESVAISKATRGRILIIVLMNNDFVSEQIVAGRVAGVDRCEKCFWQGACLRAAEGELRRFVVEHEMDLYLNEDMGGYVREGSSIDWPSIDW